jgi:hypothetical protein
VAWVLAFWAVGRFITENNLVEGSVDQLAAGPEQAGTPVFRGMASALGGWARTRPYGSCASLAQAG